MKDQVLAAALRLIKSWRSLVTAHVPIKPDHPPSAIVLFAGIAGPLDELDRLVGDGAWVEPERLRWEYRLVDRPCLFDGRWVPGARAAVDCPDYRPLPPLDGTESPDDCLRKLGEEGWGTVRPRLQSRRRPLHSQAADAKHRARDPVSLRRGRPRQPDPLDDLRGLASLAVSFTLEPARTVAALRAIAGLATKLADVFEGMKRPA